MKILVTGGAGFIGSHIVDECVENGYEVVVIDNLSSGKKEHINPKASFHCVDIQSDEIMKVMEKEKPDIICHQAAQIHVTSSILDPKKDASINILGTIQLLEAARKYSVKKIIYASTAAVYGDPQFLPIDEQHPIHPISGYGCSKYTGERYIEMYATLHGMQYTILRYANVYGERQDSKGEGGVISIFIDQAIQKKPLTIFGDGLQTRDYVYVKDVARANLSAMTHGINEIINIGTGSQISLNEVVEYIDDSSQQKNDVKYLDERRGDIRDSVFNPRKAAATLHWESCCSFLEGLVRAYAYSLDKHRRISNN